MLYVSGERGAMWNEDDDDLLVENELGVHMDVIADGIIQQDADMIIGNDAVAVIPSSSVRRHLQHTEQNGNLYDLYCFSTLYVRS